MSLSKFIQIHSLTSYPASLLNRDDVGLAKRMPFGGAVRTRISSQCLKRHWRTTEDGYALKFCDDNDQGMSVRSRYSFDHHVYRPLIDEDHIDQRVAHAVTEALMALVLGSKEAKPSASDGKRAPRQSAQVVVLGLPELAYLRKEAKAICDTLGDPAAATKAVDGHFDPDRRKNIERLKMSCGLDAAMFGRFITGDIFANADSAVSVAHAFTVHAEEAEADYFSAVDDLQKYYPEGGAGAGHINSSELTSGFYYGYVAMDLPCLIRNLGNDTGLIAEIVRRMVHLIATVSPGAKKGSTAPYAYADLMLVEAGDAQPRTLANSFLRPVPQAPDVVANAYSALASHLHKLDACYGRTERRATALSDATLLQPVLRAEELSSSISHLAEWTAARAKEAA